MNFNEFAESLNSEAPPQDLSTPLKALWYDSNGDWDAAHVAVQDDEDRASARVHAYLHRKEGDLWNARYWYRIAGSRPTSGPLDEEREWLIKDLLESKDTVATRRYGRSALL